MRYVRAIMLAVLAAGVTAAALTGAPVADEPKTQLKKAALQKLKAAAAKKTADAGKPGEKVVTLPTEAKVAKPLPAVLAPAALVRQIDALIDAKLAAEKVTASPQTGDAEFLRRASLDLTGVIPTADAARAFLDDRDPAKRAKLIDQLLAADGYGGHLADLWTAKLYSKDSDNRFVAKEPLHKWLAEEFDKNTPWDALVTKLVTATGTAEDNPAVTFFMANRSVDKLTDAVGTHFLGQSVSCAQCHNHPFTAMKQTEYWGLAAFFSKVVTPNPKIAKLAGTAGPKLGVSEGTGPSRVKDFFPESTLKVAPHVLDGTPVKVTASEPYRPALAKWLTAPDNADFARATVNRTWALLFGHGLVNPVEDMHEGNPASHPELLDLLAGQFAAAKFDLKLLTRTLVLTNAYQRSSKPTAGNTADATLVGHATMKVMIPEQLYDSLQLLQARAGSPTGPREKAAQGPLKGRPNPNGRDAFVAFFLAGADKPNAAEYEAGIPQALRLMNSRQTLGNNPGAARSFAKPGAKPADTLEEMYLATLTRRPTADETTKMLAYLKDGGPTGLADVLWVLTNTSEFVLIR